MLQGNYLRKKRVNFTLSTSACEMLQSLALEKDVNMSDVLGMLIRQEHDKIFGRENRPNLRPVVKCG